MAKRADILHIDEIEARLKGKPRHIDLGEPSRGEVRYLIAGIFAALFAVMFLIGAVS